MPKKSDKNTTTCTQRSSGKAQKSLKLFEINAIKVATLKDLRKATEHTQEDLAITLDVGQGTVSRIEKRSDMLVSTLQHYIESLGGTLQIVATFPDRTPIVVERLGKKAQPHQKNNSFNPAPANPPADT